jgi:hypothetical protein
MKYSGVYEILTKILLLKKHFKYVVLVVLLIFLGFNLYSQESLICIPDQDKNDAVSRLLQRHEDSIQIHVYSDSLSYAYDNDEMSDVAIEQHDSVMIRAISPINTGRYIEATGQMTSLRDLVLELNLGDLSLEMYNTYDGSKQRTSWRECTIID